MNISFTVYKKNYDQLYKGELFLKLGLRPIKC